MSEIKGKLKEYKVDRLNDYIFELASWCYNVNGDEYMKDIHKRTRETDPGDYAIGKFHDMQKDFVRWYGTLDSEQLSKHKQTLMIVKGGSYEQNRQRQDN